MMALTAEAMLQSLRRRTDEWLPARELAAALRLSPEDAAAAVAELQREGYVIEVDAAAGYRFRGPGAMLIAREIAAGMDTGVIGRRVHVLAQTPSTNDDAWRLALAGEPEGAVVLAEEQSAGRGRMGRRWHSPAGVNVLMSLILRPPLQADQGNLLTVMSSVAVAQALHDRLHLQARIRWPNDVTIKERKVAGILVEGRPMATGTTFVVGIGMNANLQRDQLPPDIRDTATSLALETGAPVNRNEAARWILMALDRWYRDLRSGDYGRIARSWRRMSSTVGARVALLENGREFHGRVLDLSLEEGLIVRLDEGYTRLFHPSTVSLLHPPYGKPNP